MDGTRDPASKKRKHSFSVRAMSSVIPQQMRKKRNVLPCVSSFPNTSRRGYLWRLSGRRVLTTASWKTKYFVLHEEKLYYYASMKGRAGGVIDLKSFVDCVEAPLSDQKKANNVFFLVAEERGFFDQGRYYLSAETLSEMKGWVSDIRLALGNNRSQARKEYSNDVKEITQDTNFSSPMEGSIHRSNSANTLYSTIQDQKGLKNLKSNSWQKRSMDVGPLLGLGDEDHDLTYSYSSDEEGLNTSLPVNFLHKSPRSADTSLRRQAMKRGAHFISLDERSSSDRLRTPTYLSFEDLLYPDTENYGSALRKKQHESIQIGDMSTSSDEYKIQLQNMALDVKKNSDGLAKLSRTHESECGSGRINNEHRVDELGERLDQLQTMMVRLETQATNLMQEISSASYFTKQCVTEAEKSKEEYHELKEKVELILFQLQKETATTKFPSLTNPRISDRDESNVNMYNPDWVQTFPKQKVTPMTPYQPPSILRSSNGSDNSLTRKNRHMQANVKICQDPGHANQIYSPQMLYSQSKEDIKQGTYTKPHYSQPYAVKSENYKSLRRRSLINYGYTRPGQETQNYRNSQLVEEEANEKEESEATV